MRHLTTPTGGLRCALRSVGGLFRMLGDLLNRSGHFLHGGSHLVRLVRLNASVLRGLPGTGGELLGRASQLLAVAGESTHNVARGRRKSIECTGDLSKLIIRLVKDLREVRFAFPHVTGLGGQLRNELGSSMRKRPYDSRTNRHQGKNEEGGAYAH